MYDDDEHIIRRCDQSMMIIHGDQSMMIRRCDQSMMIRRCDRFRRGFQLLVCIALIYGRNSHHRPVRELLGCIQTLATCVNSYNVVINVILIL